MALRRLSPRPELLPEAGLVRDVEDELSHAVRADHGGENSRLPFAEELLELIFKGFEGGGIARRRKSVLVGRVAEYRDARLKRVALVTGDSAETDVQPDDHRLAVVCPLGHRPWAARIEYERLVLRSSEESHACTS